MNTTTEQHEALRIADALRDGTYLLSVERNATEATLRRIHAEATDLRRDLSIARAELALMRGRPVDVDEFNRATTMRDRLARALRRLLSHYDTMADKVVARDAWAVLNDFDADRAAIRRAYLADEYRSGLDSPPR